MKQFTRESRLNIRVDVNLRQDVELVAAEMDCSPSMAARYLLNEALALRHIEGLGEAPTTAQDFLKRIAVAEVRADKRGGWYRFSEDVRGVLRAIGIRKPRP